MPTEPNAGRAERDLHEALGKLEMDIGIFAKITSAIINLKQSVRAEERAKIRQMCIDRIAFDEVGKGEEWDRGWDQALREFADAIRAAGEEK